MKADGEARSEDEPEWVKSHHAAQKAADEGDTSEAQMQTMQAFAQIIKEAGNEPDPPHLLELKKAHECEAVADWDGAEAAFRRAIEAELKERGQSNQGLSSLARFYSFLGRDTEALDAIRKSTLAVRQADFGEIFLTIALSAEISYLLHAKKLNDARSLLDEAISVNTDDGLMLTNLRLLEAHYSILNNDVQTAESILKDEWPHLEKWRDAQFMAGYQRALATWWKIRAHCQHERGSSDEEIEALRQSVHFSRVVAQARQLDGPYKFNALATALHQLAKALRDNGDETAKYAFAESRSLRQQIGLPPLD